MKFNNDKAIYVQIADRLCDEILTGKYNDDERIPSVREYAVLLEVNTNTAVSRMIFWHPRHNIQQARTGLLCNEGSQGHDSAGKARTVYGGKAARTVPQHGDARHNNSRHKRSLEQKRLTNIMRARKRQAHWPPGTGIPPLSLTIEKPQLTYRRHLHTFAGASHEKNIAHDAT